MEKMVDEISQKLEMTRVESSILEDIASKQFEGEQKGFKSTDDFLESARVRLCKVSHLSQMFPDLKPLQSPIFERASRSSAHQTIATTLFA